MARDIKYNEWESCGKNRVVLQTSKVRTHVHARLDKKGSDAEYR
jgi:hypothetical protein